MISFFLCGCDWFRGGDKPLTKVIKEYKQQRVVKDTRGNLYKIAERYGGKSIPVLYSSDDGKTWKSAGSAETYLTYSAWGSVLTVDNEDTLYLSWSGNSAAVETLTQEDLLSQFKAVFFSKSTDGGKNWQEQIILNSKETAGTHPVIFVDSKKVIYICWYEKLFKGMIYFTFSSDGGRNWKEVESLRSGEDICFSKDSKGMVYLTYAGGEKKNMPFISFTEDRGKNWHTVTPGELKVLVKEPYTASIDDTMYLIFQAWIPNIFEAMPQGDAPTYELHYFTSKDRGETWSKMQKVK
ncbi:MAG: exo-alpha-sialidase [Candidatus Omnitrophica bacterium]|nr:exo-alpha-sialidase [Candidatus Omnitrophota bacterium]MBU1047882.1 exo-alpha-sialidase [Candidatus Omnitrophota bacterium]MBU1888505.1 exo-alpha-sialidase [Candidatus Omnitrophota bacterium]